MSSREVWHTTDVAMLRRKLEHVYYAVAETRGGSSERVNECCSRHGGRGAPHVKV